MGEFFFAPLLIGGKKRGGVSRRALWRGEGIYALNKAGMKFKPKAFKKDGMRSRKAYPLKLLPSIESEAEPVKLPLFEGKQLFRYLSLRVLGDANRYRAFTEKLNGNALIFLRKEGLKGSIEVSKGKDRKKKLKKIFPQERLS